MGMTGSRVMIFFSHRDRAMSAKVVVWRVFVWDWKTGDLVMLLRFDELQFTHFTSLGARYLILGPEGVGHAGRAGDLP